MKKQVGEERKIEPSPRGDETYKKRKMIILNHTKPTASSVCAKVSINTSRVNKEKQWGNNTSEQNKLSRAIMLSNSVEQ